MVQINIKQLSTFLAVIVSIGTSIAAIVRWVASPIKKIDKRLANLEQDTTMLLCDRLQQAHDYHVRKGWCSTSDKERLLLMHELYRKRGRNHLADHNEQDIINLPTSKEIS